MQPLLVTNLPPNTTLETLKEKFSVYGQINFIYFVSDFYLTTYYNLNAAYLFFCEERSVDFFIKDFVDVVIDGYFTEIQSISGSQLVNNTAIIYGISQGITKEDLFDALRFDNHNVEISIKRPGSPQNDGYAFIQFKDKDCCKLFLLSNSHATIGNCVMAIREYPQPKESPQQYHVVNLSCVPSNYMRIRKIKKLNNFTIHTPIKDYKVSSKVLAFSSNIIANQIKLHPYKSDFTIVIPKYVESQASDELFEKIFDAIYGAEIDITLDNCDFIHAVASQLEVSDLIISSGAVCYEKLTLNNFKKILKDLYANKLDYKYVIEFICSHFTEIIQAYTKYNLFDLPEAILKEITHNPYVSSLTEQDITSLFQNSLILSKIDQSDISNMNNPELNLNKNRDLLIEYLNQSKSISTQNRE